MTKYDSGHDVLQAGPMLPASLDWLGERAAEAAGAELGEYGLTAFSRNQMRELNDVLREASAVGDQATITAVRETLAQAYMPSAGHVSRLVGASLGLDAATERQLQVHGEHVVRGVVIGVRHQGEGEVAVAYPRSYIIREVEERLWMDALRAVSHAHVSWADAPDILRMINAQESFVQTAGREPSVAELADALGCDAWRAEELWNLVRPWSVPSSLLEPVDDGIYDEQLQDSGDVTSELDAALAAAPSAEDEAMQGIALKELVQVIAKGGLTHRELRALVLRSGILPAGPLEYDELGKTLGVTRERARQIVMMAYAKAAWAIYRSPDL